MGDYILGGIVQLKGVPLVPTGQWDAYLPEIENQSRDGFEPYACVSYAILNAVEMLIKKVYGSDENFSDRFLAYSTGTQAKQGNDPTTVCTFLGRKGDVHEADWPYDSKNFYATPPQPLYTLAKEFIAHYKYDNQWVPATPIAMIDALTRSPLTVAGFAWQSNNDGLYYWPDGAMADHYFVIYGYVRNQHWLAFDTYDNNYKKLVWDYPFTQVKEHSLHRQTVDEGWFAKFKAILRSIAGI